MLGSGLISEPEDDGCGDDDGVHEDVCASVTSGCDAAPILELGKQVLDRVALAIERRVVRVGMLAVLARWNAGRDAEALEGCAKPVAVAAAIGDQFAGGRQRVDQQAGALMVLICP